MQLMPRPRPKYLHRTVNRHDTVVWYVHVPGHKRVRIRSPQGTAEFYAEVEAAVALKSVEPVARSGKGSLAWLVDRYRESPAWGSLSFATQRQRNNFFRQILAKDGDKPFAAVQRKHIMAARDKRQKTPHQANCLVKALRGLFQWALDAELVKTDPTATVKMIKAKSEGFKVWTVAEVVAFEAHWAVGTRERLALDVLLYTGLRRGDACRLGRPHIRRVDGVEYFRIKTEKYGVWVDAPILPPLARSIAVAPTGDLTFIATQAKRPYTKESFGNWFREACDAAGLPDCAAHGLRKAGAARSAENGATTTQLKALFGWTDDKMPNLYTRSAERARVASDASATLARRNRE
jgi:integrase